MYGMRIVAWADGRPYAGEDRWLADFDADAQAGRGLVKTTADPARAVRFVSTETAWDYWRQISPTLPLRPDGKPNRPLTAFIVSIDPLPDP